MKRISFFNGVGVLIIASIMLAIFGFSQAHAQQDATPQPSEHSSQLAFSIYPKGGHFGDYFQPTIRAGHSSTQTVVLANTGEDKFTGNSYAINAITRVNGGFSVADSGTTPTGGTTWIHYPSRDYTILPGKGIEVTFEIQVPQDAAPGEYISAIVLENAPASVVGSTSLKQVIRYPVPVVITVPGAIRPSFEIGDISVSASAEFATLAIGIENDGNVRVRPAGTVNVTDEHGDKLFGVKVAMGSVLPHDSTTLEVGLPPLPAGKYEIAVDLADPGTKATATGKVTVTASAPATPLPPPPVQFQSASAVPLPDADHLQFLDVKATISNSGEALTNVKVVLHATKDGKVVEDFALNSSLSIPNGETPIEARYLPATGWTSGEWSFTLSVEAVTGGNGVAQVLATADLGSITIP